MRFLVIVGSQRKGNGFQAGSIMIEEARRCGATANLIFLGTQQLDFCQGVCHHQCHPRDDKGYLLPGGWQHCTREDDGARILKSMVEADVLVLISPVLFGNMSSNLKILMERTNALCSFDQEKDFSFLAGKIGGAVAIGGARHGGQERVLSDMMHYFAIVQMMPLGLGEYQAPQGLALVADGLGDLGHDQWVDYGIKQADAKRYLIAYTKKLLGYHPSV